jgi:protein-S-isoprenylcysteine O-methyltransferase Ste14
MILTAVVRQPPLWLEKVWPYRCVIMLASIALSMILVEFLVFKTHRRNFDFSAPREMDISAWKRVGARWVAACACLGLATVLYSTLKFYNLRQFPFLPRDIVDANIFREFYVDFTVFREFFIYAVPIVVVFSVPYFWMCERFARPGVTHDEYLILAIWLKKFPGPLFKGDTPAQKIENQHVANLFRGLLVKFFYIPLMLVWTVNGFNDYEHIIHEAISGLQNASWQSPGDIAMNFMMLHRSLFVCMLVLDISIASIGYVISMRLLDNHVVTAEPTFFGWMAALVCYPPFRGAVLQLMLWTPSGEVWPRDMFTQHTTFSITVSVVMILLWGVYVWATVAFGLRFSNLTNRGVICGGPYAHIRHPAYIAKNSMWWLEGLPYVVNNISFLPVFIFRMACVNLIYGLRAWTEERHLMREAHYREYCQKVPWRFIPGVW